MKTLAPGLQAHLDTGATTLAWCWKITRADGSVLNVETRCRIDTANELDYYTNGGILQYVLRSLVAA